MPAQNGGEIFPKFRIFSLPIGKIFEAHAQIFQDVFLQPDKFFCACDPQNLWVWKGWPKVFFAILGNWSNSTRAISPEVGVPAGSLLSPPCL